MKNFRSADMKTGQPTQQTKRKPKAKAAPVVVNPNPEPEADKE